ncbi:hypothetical protein OAU79_00090 [bacterium]|nr:hypothetical protein [bacterium]
MPFGFDPRKLVEEDQQEKDKETKEAIDSVLTFEEIAEKNEAFIRNKSTISDAFDGAFKALREHKFQKKYGEDAYIDEKLKEDPEYRDSRKFSDAENKQYYRDELESMRGVMKGVKYDFSTGNTIYPEEDKLTENQKKFFKKGKYSTLASQAGESDKEEPFKFNTKEPGTGGFIFTESEGVPFESEVGVTESIISGVGSGIIKIPKGFVNLGAMIMDLGAEENLSVDKSKVAQLENWWDKTMFGMIEKKLDSKAKETAVGRITEALVQLYGGWKAVGSSANKITDKAFEMYNKATSAIKKNKYLRTAGNKDGYKLAKEVEKWNKLSGKQKFVGLFVGGGVTGGVVYDAENIGTFGDIFFDEGELTALDRDGKRTAKDDAMRMLYNKLKFAGEMGFPIIPSVVGAGKVAKSILDANVKRAGQATKFDKFVEKYFARPLRSRGPFPEEQFQAMQRLEGKKSSANLLSTDYLRNIDQITKQISKYSQSAANTSGMTDELSELIVKLINKGNLGIKNGRVVVKGFDDASLDTFWMDITKKLKVKPEDATRLIDELMNVHTSWAQFLNGVLKGKNLNVAPKEFVQLMNERIRSSLSSEYKIFGEKSLKPIKEYAPSNSVIDEVADIFVRSAKANGKTLKKEDAQLIVQDIVKNVELDPQTFSPIFRFEASDIAKDRALITKNISENITGGGKFKPDKKGGLIQTKSDLAAFKSLFGEFKNANSIIANVTTDLAEIASRDRFYNVIKQGSDDLIKKGEIGIVYPTYNSARKAFGLDAEIVDASRGLQLPQKLGEQAYTVPINGMFTTKVLADGLRKGAANSIFDVKNIVYQYAVMVPKGLIQAGKTVGGPFTHARNFSSGAVTTVSMGNISLLATNPGFILKSLKTAFNTLQPQILYRNKPGAKSIDKYATESEFADALKGEGGQALYRFLLEEGMVNQSAIYRDVMGLIEDTAKTGFLQKMWDKLGRRTKKFLKGAQDMYIAEDDIWKIFNFFAEDFKIARAYESALKSGKLKKLGMEMPSRLDIMKMATKNVREMLPNYAYVSELVQASRRSPLGNFVSWPAEIIRTSGNIMSGAKKEMQNPILARIGVERAAGFAITVGTIGPAAVWGASQAYGFTKEKLMALREFIPYFSENSTVLPVYEDGKYKYIDFSRAFFYDVVTAPVQTAFTEMNRREDEAVIPSLAIGLTKAFAQLADPFVSESIWISGVADLYFRKGVTKQGQKIWNERDGLGTKVSKAIGHLTKLYTPGSAVQLERLYSSLTGKSIKGTEYEVSDELLGLIGLRKAPVDIPRSMEIMIGQFRKAERNERNLIYAGTLTGDPIKDDNKIIEQFIFANKQRLETFEVMRRQYDAAKLLGMKEKEIKQIFSDRGMKPLYKAIKTNKFNPFGISDGMKDAYERVSEKNNIPNPLSKRILKRLNKIEKKLKKQRLNKDFIIDEQKYLFNEQNIIEKGIELFKQEEKSNIPAGFSQLPEMPEPVVESTQMSQNIDPQTNLTATEEALLSPTEKVIAGRT